MKCCQALDEPREGRPRDTLVASVGDGLHNGDGRGGAWVCRCGLGWKSRGYRESYQSVHRCGPSYGPTCVACRRRSNRLRHARADWRAAFERDRRPGESDSVRTPNIFVLLGVRGSAASEGGDPDPRASRRRSVLAPVAAATAALAIGASGAADIRDTCDFGKPSCPVIRRQTPRSPDRYARIAKSPMSTVR